MREMTKQYDVGVLVGRFQVHELHDGHRDLIRFVCSRHEKVIVVLGLSPLPTSVNNPLDFEARKQMILAEFPDVNVMYVKDQPSDDVWSRKLDEVIGDLLAPGQTAVLYGARDSFIPHYNGRFATQELTAAQGSFYSGTAVRKQIAKARVKGSPDFRAGVIWASQARFPTSFQCVDIAPLDEMYERVLLGRKPNERRYRFLGGFVDPRDTSLEHAAARETNEEAGVELAEVRYVGSTRVDDWRYQGEPDGILTALFAGKVLHGRPTPGDDIEEVRWFRLPLSGNLSATEVMRTEAPSDVITADSIYEGHRALLEMLARYTKEQRR